MIKSASLHSFNGLTEWTAALTRRQEFIYSVGGNEKKLCRLPPFLCGFSRSLLDDLIIPHKFKKEKQMVFMDSISENDSSEFLLTFPFSLV